MFGYGGTKNRGRLKSPFLFLLPQISLMVSIDNQKINYSPFGVQIAIGKGTKQDF
jgi:hypothetical protein